MDRSITSLPLSSESIDLLQKAGFLSVESLRDLRPTELSRELGCTQEMALSIIKSIQPVDKQVTIANIPTAKVFEIIYFYIFVFHMIDSFELYMNMAGLSKSTRCRARDHYFLQGS